MRHSLICSSLICLAIATTPVWAQSDAGGNASDLPYDRTGVVTHFVDLGYATYTDSAKAAENLRDDVIAMFADLNEETFDQARISWQTARVVYKQSEIFHYASPITAALIHRVDNWPIDEGFIDYVDGAYQGAEGNELANANIIGSTELVIGGETVDVSQITTDLLADKLHLANDVPTNVAAGFQAIEFLLWGQDTDLEEAGDGSRTIADFDTANCPDDFCERRRQYLLSAVELLISDLNDIANRWAPSGAARSALLENPDQSLTDIVSAFGAVVSAEVLDANLRRGLDGRSAELESDAFSDYSHASYLLALRGALNTYLGEYYPLEGGFLEGPALSDLLIDADAEFDRQFRVTLSMTMARMRVFLHHVRDEVPLDKVYVEHPERALELANELITALEAQAAAIRQIGDVLQLGDLTFALPPFEVAMIDATDNQTS